MKTNQKGFSVLEILIVVVVVGLLGAVGWLVYDRQKSKTSNQETNTQTSEQKSNTQIGEQKQESAKQETKVVDPYEGWKTYADSKLSYSFKYPDTWSVTPINYGDKLGAIRIDSSDIKTEEWLIGATDVTKGSIVALYAQSSGDYTAFTGLQKQLKDNGTIKPSTLTLGSHKAIEYAFAYEGPEITYIRLAISDSQYIETSFISEGQESAHPNHDAYKKILESIK